MLQCAPSGRGGVGETWPKRGPWVTFPGRELGWRLGEDPCVQPLQWLRLESLKWGSRPYYVHRVLGRVGG